jgi:uncharacterized protein YcbX
MLLSEIWIYPVKSLGGIRLKTSEVQERGLKYDRRWMVVDENGKFLTQRVNPHMVFVDVALHDQGLILSSRLESGNEVAVPFKSVSGEPIRVTIWNDIVEARSVSDEADAWLTKQLKKNVRIVEMTDSTQRKMSKKDAVNGELVSFADDFPYLLISEGSLLDLNSKLAHPVEMQRFRPNFVVSGPEAFAEDLWQYIRIGDTSFELVKPCERCILTTIDIDTGLKGPEPLKTLATYRRQNKKILFGQNVIALNYGTVREGDAVTILKEKDGLKKSDDNHITAVTDPHDR